MLFYLIMTCLKHGECCSGDLVTLILGLVMPFYMMQLVKYHFLACIPNK